MNMKNYLLTDFSKERWNGINLASVEEAFNELVENIKPIGFVLGQIKNPSELDINLELASHSIKNLTFVDGKIYGDVGFLDNELGRTAEELINGNNHIFGIRGAGTMNGIYDEGSELIGQEIIFKKYSRGMLLNQ